MSETVFMVNLLLVSVTTSGMILFLKLYFHKMGKRYAARWKCLIWMLMAIRLLFPVIISFPRTPVNLNIRNPSVLYVIETEEITGKTTLPALRLQKKWDSVMEAHEEVTISKSVTLVQFLFVLWVTVGILFLIYHFINYQLYRRRLFRWSYPCKDAEIRLQFIQLEEELNISGHIRLLETQKNLPPTLFGLWKPYLILPAGCYKKEEIYFILKHEMIHYLHQDIRKKLLFLVVNCIHWFNPAVWILSRTAAEDMELDCDDGVVLSRGYGERKAYSEMLLNAAEKQLFQGKLLTENFYGGAKMMKKRIINILNPAKKGRGGLLSLGLMAALLLGQATIGYCSDDYAEKESFKNHPAKAILLSEDADLEENHCKVRYSAITDDVSYMSYGVYGDITEEQFEQIAEYTELMLTGNCLVSKPDDFGLPLKKLSFAFYQEDTNELLDAFMYKDGERLPADDADIFVAGNTRNQPVYIIE